MSSRQIIIIGFLVAVLELAVGIWYLRQTSEKPEEKMRVIAPTETGERARIFLTADDGEVKVSETVRVAINLDVTGKSSASDVVLKYDPNYLSTTNPPFKEGQAYARLVFNQADLISGEASVSAISNLDKSFEGTAVLATIELKALKKGQTKIEVLFFPGQTRDSNVVVDTKDVLREADGLTLQIN